MIYQHMSSRLVSIGYEASQFIPTVALVSALFQKSVIVIGTGSDRICLPRESFRLDPA